MKNCKYIISCLLLGLICISCNDELPYDPDLFSCVSDVIVNTEAADDVESVDIIVGSTVEFVDNSQGLTSVEWIFPEGVAQDLNGAAVNSQSSDKVEVKFIKVGEHSIIARQTFELSSIFVDNKIIESKTYDRVIEVSVQEQLKASFSAKILGSTEELTIADNAETEIETGTTVVFTVTSEPQTTSNKFILTYEDGSTTETDAAYTNGAFVANIKVSKLGIVDVELQSANALASDSAAYEALLNCVPTAEPFVAETYTIVDNKSISIALSGAIDQSSIEAASDSFTINVSNPNGFNQDVDVVMTINELNAQELVFTLSGDQLLYDNDVITINYSPASSDATIRATDGRELDAITDYVFQKIIEIDNPGEQWNFEADDIASYWTTGYDHSLWYGFVEDPVDSTNTVLKIDMGTSADPDVPAAGMANVWCNSLGAFNEGVTYTYSFDMYIEDEREELDLNNFFEATVYRNVNDWNPANKIIEGATKMPGLPIYEWFTINITQTITADQANGTSAVQIRLMDQFVTSKPVVYFDNIRVSRSNTRP